MCFDPFVPFVSAQTKPPAPPRAPAGPRFEISVGAGFLGGGSLGDADADLRGRSGAPFDFFNTSSRLAGSVPIEARLGFLVGPRSAIEVRGAWARPDLQTSVTGDVEGAPPITVAERVDLYSIDVGLFVAFKTARPRTLMPFVSGGAGYVGAVHEGLTLLENGVVYRGGGGFKYPLAVGRRGRLKGVGVRVDGALVVMTGGVTTGSGATRQVAGTGSLYMTF